MPGWFWFLTVGFPIISIVFLVVGVAFCCAGFSYYKRDSTSPVSAEEGPASTSASTSASASASVSTAEPCLALGEPVDAEVRGGARTGRQGLHFLSKVLPAPPYASSGNDGNGSDAGENEG